MRTKALTLVVIATLCAPGAMAHDAKPATGTKVDNFTLRDYRGNPYSLDEVRKDKIVALVFLGTECPLAKIYASRLNELAEKYEPQGVAFVGVNPNRPALGRGVRVLDIGQRGIGQRVVGQSDADRGASQATR